MDPLAPRVLRRFLATVAMEFPTEEARSKYLKDHPGADPKNHTVKKHEEGVGGDGGGSSSSGGTWKDHKTFQQVSKSRQTARSVVDSLDKTEKKLTTILGGRRLSTSDVEDVHKKEVSEHKKLVDTAGDMAGKLEAYFDKASDVEIPDRRTLDLVSAVKSSANALKKMSEAHTKIEETSFSSLESEGKTNQSEGKGSWYQPVQRHVSQIVRSGKEIQEAIERAGTLLYEIEHKT